MIDFTDRATALEFANMAANLEWGSEDQINAENELCDYVEKIHDANIPENDDQDFECKVFRMTVQERVTFCMEILGHDYDLTDPDLYL